MQIRKLIINAETLNSPEKHQQECWEFENGLILFEGVADHDWFFASRNDIDLCGNDIIDSLKETTETKEMNKQSLAIRWGEYLEAYSIDHKTGKGATEYKLVKELIQRGGDMEETTNLSLVQLEGKAEKFKVLAERKRSEISHEALSRILELLETEYAELGKQGHVQIFSAAIDQIQKKIAEEECEPF